jgi:hypothetical protein
MIAIRPRLLPARGDDFRTSLARTDIARDSNRMECGNKSRLTIPEGASQTYHERRALCFPAEIRDAPTEWNSTEIKAPLVGGG